MGLRTWSMDGGVLTNQASHHIDMLTEVIRGTQRGKISVEEAKIKLGKI